MAQSRLYRSLDIELPRLAAIYLDFSPRLNGAYTVTELSKASAYTLFCHAEFEIFVEGWATRILVRAKERWISGKATRPTVILSAMRSGRESIQTVPSKDIWSEMAMSSIQHHENVIRSNHGIREENICSLLGPLGVDLRNIDPILFGDMTAFGKIRGDHAHQAHKTQTKNLFDPFDRRSKALKIAGLLNDLDTALQSYLKSV